MRWPDYLPAVVCMLYLLSSFGYFLEGKNGLSLGYFCYAFANVGLIWASMEIQ